MIFPSPAAGFDEPFAMLLACHERVERSLLLLERLAAHLLQHGADAQGRDAARDVLRYFDIAAPQHHEDEERHVLPALRTHDQAALADRIAADHVVMNAAWQSLRPWLLAIGQGDASVVMPDLPRFSRAPCRSGSTPPSRSTAAWRARTRAERSKSNDRARALRQQ